MFTATLFTAAQTWKHIYQPFSGWPDKRHGYLAAQWTSVQQYKECYRQTQQLG